VHEAFNVRVDMDIRSYSDITRSLVDVAMGRQPADLVIRNGRWVCVQSGEILTHTDIAVKGERIAYVGLLRSATPPK
jgi:adenine deaminase